LRPGDEALVYLATSIDDAVQRLNAGQA